MLCKVVSRRNEWQQTLGGLTCPLAGPAVPVRFRRFLEEPLRSGPVGEALGVWIGRLATNWSYSLSTSACIRWPAGPGGSFTASPARPMISSNSSGSRNNAPMSLWQASANSAMAPVIDGRGRGVALVLFTLTPSGSWCSRWRVCCPGPFG